VNSPVPFSFYSYDFTICPWLKHEKMLRNPLAYHKGDMIDFIKSYIRHGKYVHLYLDEYHVPQRMAYQVFNFLHENLIFGYDDETETFDIVGFDDKIIFKQTKVSYTDFSSAYEDVDVLLNSPTAKSGQFRFFNTINVFEKNSNAQYAFNSKLIVETLYDYLEGHNMSNRFSMLREPWDRSYGMEGYHYIKSYYELLLQNRVSCDVRYLHNLWEQCS